MCLALAVIMAVGIMPGIAMTAHANTTIKEISVTNVTVPEIGEKPDYTASVAASAAYYIGTDISGVNSDVNGILWVNGSSQMNQDATFAEDGEYDVRMEIYAKDGYVFDTKANLTVTINGKTGRVISRPTDTMIYIGYKFGAPITKEIINSIEISHETNIEAKNYTKNLYVSKINGVDFEEERTVSFQWFRSTSNFTDINETGVSAWDDSKDGYKFVGGYAYGLRINKLPEIDGYKYNPSTVVALKTPSGTKSAQLDANGNCYFFWDKLAYKPDLESVSITMDGYYVGANVMDLTFTSGDPIKTDGGYGMNSGRRYTINLSTDPAEYLSNSTFMAGKQYYLFFYLESDLDIKGLMSENVKLNGQRAYASGIHNGRTYYRFSLPVLTEEDIEKTKVTSVVVSLPKAKPSAGDALYYPTVVSVNDDTNLAGAAKTSNSKWYQCDYHVPAAIYEDMKGTQFVQGKSYMLWLDLVLDNGYEFADNYAVIVQAPGGSLEGELDEKGRTFVSYVYNFNLGAPTELPELKSYATTISGYQIGSKIEETALDIKINGKSLPEKIPYGIAYAVLDANKQFVETGVYAADTQYYLEVMVYPYNCDSSNINADYLKSIVTLNGASPEVVTPLSDVYYIATFKLPVLKEGAACNGTDHDFKKVVVPATTEEDGETYEICTKGCDTVRNKTVIPRIKSVNLSKEYYVYDGTTKKPTVTVKDRTGKVLTKGKDYTVVYPTASKKAGLYIIDVVMKGNYEGLDSKNFQILPAVKTAKLSYSTTVYNGKAKSPSVTVKDSKGKKLVKNTDYTVTVPKGRTAIGKYNYTIKFKGKYADVKSKKLTLTIKPAKPAIQTPKAAKKAITVKWKKAAKAQTTGYQVMAATDSSFKKNVKKAYVTGYSKTSYKMTNLKAKTKYYVRVRTYKTVKGEKIYSDWSKVKTIKTL